MHPSASLPNSADAPAASLGNPMSEPGILVVLRLLLVIAWMDTRAGSSYSVCQARIIVPGEIAGDKSWDCLGEQSWDLLWSRVLGGLSPCSSGGAGGRSCHRVLEVLLLLPACSWAVMLSGRGDGDGFHSPGAL